MKNVPTHCGNQLREFYYWASFRDSSDHLAHNSKVAGYAMQPGCTSTCGKMYTENGSKWHSGLCLLWKMSLQASCLGLLPHEEGLLVGPANHAPSMPRRWSPWERLHLGWVRESADHSHGALAHLKEICIPFQGDCLMQCHQACPSTLVHPLVHETVLISYPHLIPSCAHLLAFTTCPELELTYGTCLLCPKDRAPGCQGAGIRACRSRWILGPSKLARQRHKQEATCTSTDIEHGLRLLHPALCDPRGQPRHRSHTAGRGAPRARFRGHGSRPGQSWGRALSPPGPAAAGGTGWGRDRPRAGRAEGGPAPRPCAWRPPAAAAVPAPGSWGRAPAGTDGASSERSAPARLGRTVRGRGGERRELYI